MPEDEYEDQLVALQATVDQAVATIPIFAPVAWAWFTSYRDQGFDDEQALYLAGLQSKLNDD